MSDHDDDDDDVFAPKSTPAADSSYTFDNTAQAETTSSSNNYSNNKAFANLPKYLQEALAKLIRATGGSGMFNQMGGRDTALTVVECFHEYIATCTANQRDVEVPAMIRATFDVLDEMTEGRVSTRTEVYMIEIKLSNMMSIYSSCNDLMARLINIQRDQTDRSTRMINHLRIYLEILSFNIDRMKARYIAVAGESNYNHSVSLVETGMLEYMGLATTLMSGHMPHSDNLRYGDMTMRTQQETILREVLFTMLYTHLYETEENLKKAEIEQVDVSM